MKSLGCILIISLVMLSACIDSSMVESHKQTPITTRSVMDSTKTFYVGISSSQSLKMILSWKSDTVYIQYRDTVNVVTSDRTLVRSESDWEYEDNSLETAAGYYYIPFNPGVAPVAGVNLDPDFTLVCTCLEDVNHQPSPAGCHKENYYKKLQVCEEFTFQCLVGTGYAELNISAVVRGTILVAADVIIDNSQ